MADVNKDIQISLKLDDQGAVAGIQAVNGEAVNLGTEGAKSARAFGDTMKIALGNLAASAAEKLLSSLADLARNGIALVNQGLSDANMQRLLNNRLSLAIENAGGSVDEFLPRLKNLAAELQATTNYSNEQIESAQSMLLAYKGVQGPEGVEGLTRSLLDMAAGMEGAEGGGASLDRVAQALGRTLEGNVGGLSRMGVALTESEENAIKAADGMERVRLVQAAIEDRFGGAAERLSDPYVQLQHNIDDLVKYFGRELSPTVLEVISELKRVAESEEAVALVRDAAQALADQLVRGLQIGSAFVRLLVDNRSEIKTSAQVVATLGAAVATYVATTKAQAAATQLAILWEKRAAIARLASMRAQKALNLAMRMNPVGLIITALTVVIPLIYKFRSQLMDAAASVLDFGAKAIRGLQGVVDWFQKIADKIPEAWLKVDPVMRGLVNAINGADTAVDATAGKMEEWAMGLRASADAAEGARVSIVDSKSAMESQADIFDENTDQTESNTAAVDDNTDAVERNAAARKAANEIPPRPTPTVEPEDETLDAPDVSMEADLDLITGNSLGGIERLLREGMIDSISETDRAIQELQRQFNNASTAEARRQIQALILTLQQQRNEMTSVAQDTSLSFQQIAGAVQGFAGQMAGALQALQETAVGRSKAMFAVYKAVAITEAIVSTYLAANKAMAETPGPPPIPQIAAATVVASGLANVAKIKSARPKGAGAGGGGGDRRVEAPAVPRMRKGGRVESGGPVLVGDGPGGRITPYTELFMPDQPGRIIPRSGLNVTSGAASSGGNRHIIDKLDAVQRAFEQKQFRLQGTDQVTQQQRVMSEFSTAGIE